MSKKAKAVETIAETTVDAFDQAFETQIAKESNMVDGKSMDDIMAEKDFTLLTKSQVKARYDANIDRRKVLLEENKQLEVFYKGLSSKNKEEAAAKKIADLQAQIAALEAKQTPAASVVETPVEVAK